MEFKTSIDAVEYQDALALMEGRVLDIHNNNADDLVWFLEHPSLYTAGTSAKAADLLNPQFPVFETGRGGQFTYHGPGQRVAYVMYDMKKDGQGPDLKRYIWNLEEWIVRTLARVNVTGERREGRVGIWVVTPSGEKKIAAIGVRVRHWIAYHGIAINVNPDLTHFEGIVPCGLKEYGVTSLKDLGIDCSMFTLDEILKDEYESVFGAQDQSAAMGKACACT